MNLSTPAVLGAISMVTLSAVTVIQHSQIASIRDVIAQVPTVAVVDIDTLGTATALSSTGTAAERHQKLAQTLNDLAGEGFLIIDQKHALTAPQDTIIAPEELLEAAGISTDVDLEGGWQPPPRPNSQVQEEGE